MILHYLSAAAKSYRRHPFTATANVLTLAFGLTCFVAAHGIAKAARTHPARVLRCE